MDQTSNPAVTVAGSKSPAELALEIYNILAPHPSETRVRAVQSAMTSLGESMLSLRQNIASTAQPEAADDFADLKLGPKASRWVQKHGLTRLMLEEVFHFSENRVDIIASNVPGTSRREMTVNCYVLCGLKGLLKDDVPSLDDSEVIEFCKRMTAYDKNNHTANRQAVGNKISGTKPKFTLTGPGETAAADLVKQMTASRSG